MPAQVGIVACQLAAHMRQPKDMCHMTREQYQAAAVRIHGQPLWVPHPGVRLLGNATCKIWQLRSVA